MDLHEIKDGTRNVKAPDIATGRPQTGLSSAEDLISVLKAADLNQSRQLWRSMKFFVFAGLVWGFFLLLSLLIPEDSPLISKFLFRALLTFLFLGLGIAMAFQSKRLSRVDYAAPLSSFLASAEKRYRFMSVADLAVAISGLAILGLVAGLYLNDVLFMRYFGEDHQLAALIASLLFYAGVCVLGFAFTYLNWKRDKAPLWTAVRKMKKDLSAEETADPSTIHD